MSVLTPLEIAAAIKKAIETGQKAGVNDVAISGMEMVAFTIAESLIERGMHISADRFLVDCGIMQHSITEVGIDPATGNSIV